MKIKTTSKAIKENYFNILSLGYCEGERLFNYFEPTFYIGSNKGWLCDIYTFRKGYKCFAVSTGYGYLTYDEKKSEYKREKISKTLKIDILNIFIRRAKNERIGIFKKRIRRKQKTHNLGRGKIF